MFIVDVIPLSRGIPAGTLSYRSAVDVPKGTLITVPLRSRTVLALSVSSRSVREEKMTIKTLSFALRGGTLSKKGVLPEALVDAGNRIAQYHAVSMGSALGALLAGVLPEARASALAAGGGYTLRYAETVYEERITQYRKLIEKERAAGRATLLIAPTMIEVTRLAAAYAEYAPVVLSGELRPKGRAAALGAVLRATGLVIATPSFAWVPIAHLGAIVVERVSAGAYVLPKRPRLDMRLALMELAKARKVPITLGDLLLPLELRPDPAAAIKAIGKKRAQVIDVRKKGEEQTKFRAVPEQILKEIRAAAAEGGRAAILAVRKGYAPGVVCRDCGNTLRDGNGRALAFIQSKPRPIFRSADGKTVMDADMVCPVCSSWNLLPLGIGVERVIEELTKELPSARIVRFDSESLKSRTAAREAVAAFETPGAIAVGTEVMLPFLDPARPVDVAAIASADTLLALPFWRARERLARVGLTLLERAQNLLIATRHPDDATFSFIDDPAHSAFLTEESALRKLFSYPPFGHVLVFHTEGAAARLAESAAKITAALAPHKATRLADRAVRGARRRLSMVAKIPSGKWPDAELSARLAALPIWIEVLIDPDSLW